MLGNIKPLIVIGQNDVNRNMAHGELRMILRSFEKRHVAVILISGSSNDCYVCVIK
jgi:hypothetical protein